MHDYFPNDLGQKLLCYLGGVGRTSRVRSLSPSWHGDILQACTVARSLCWQGIVIVGWDPAQHLLCLEKSRCQGIVPFIVYRGWKAFPTKYMTFGLWASNFHSNLFLLIMPQKSVHLIMVSTKDLGIHKISTSWLHLRDLYFGHAPFLRHISLHIISALLNLANHMSRDKNKCIMLHTI